MLEKLIQPLPQAKPDPQIRDLLLIETQNHEEGGQAIIRQVQEYLSVHYREVITLGDLADRFHVNANYLSTLFRETTGATFSNYLAQIRIEQAARLLRSTHLRIHSVAQETGFSDSRYFCRVFKKITGLAPTEFCAENRTPPES